MRNFRKVLLGLYIAILIGAVPIIAIMHRDLAGTPPSATQIIGWAFLLVTPICGIISMVFALREGKKELGKPEKVAQNQEIKP